MAEILAAIQHPLSLCGFVLILLFRFLKKPLAERYPSAYPIFMVMAVVTLVAGLGLAYREAVREPATAPKAGGEAATPQPGPSSVKQTTTGAKSPAIANTKGDVDISYGASDDQEEKGDKE